MRCGWPTAAAGAHNRKSGALRDLPKTFTTFGWLAACITQLFLRRVTLVVSG
jgi:hypothetical protein